MKLKKYIFSFLKNIFFCPIRISNTYTIEATASCDPGLIPTRFGLYSKFQHIFFPKNLQSKVYGDRSLVEFGLRNDPHTRAGVNNKINFLYFFSLRFFIFCCKFSSFREFYSTTKNHHKSIDLLYYFLFFLFQILRKKQ